MTQKTNEAAPKLTAAEKRAIAAEAKAKEAAEKAAAEAQAKEAAEKEAAEAQAKEAAEKAAEAAAEAAEKAAAEAKAKEAGKNPADNTQNEPKQAESALSGTSVQDGDKGPDTAKEEQSGLGPNQLRIHNRGRRAVCHVTRQIIEAGETVVITYDSADQKRLAQGNFAQLNAFGGAKRFTVEG